MFVVLIIVCPSFCHTNTACIMDIGSIKQTFDFSIIECSQVCIFGSCNPEQKRWWWSTRWDLWNVVGLEEFIDINTHSCKGTFIGSLWPNTVPWPKNWYHKIEKQNPDIWRHPKNWILQNERVFKCWHLGQSLGHPINISFVFPSPFEVHWIFCIFWAFPQQPVSSVDTLC
jgi:hypothetical protein